jgi:hypothetical protein
VYLLCRHKYLNVDSYTVSSNVTANSTALSYESPFYIEVSHKTNVMPIFTMSSFLIVAFGLATAYLEESESIKVNFVVSCLHTYIVCFFYLTLCVCVCLQDDDTYERNNTELLTDPLFMVWHYLFVAVTMVRTVHFLVLHMYISKTNSKSYCFYLMIFDQVTHVAIITIICAPFNVYSLMLSLIPILVSMHFMYTAKTPCSSYDGDEANRSNLYFYSIFVHCYTFK